jgi:hypothetical protein
MTQRHTPQDLYLHSLPFSQATDTAHIPHVRLCLQGHQSVSYRFPDKNFICILSLFPHACYTFWSGPVMAMKLKCYRTFTQVRETAYISLASPRHVLRSTNCVSPFGAPSGSNCSSLLQPAKDTKQSLCSILRDFP